MSQAVLPFSFVPVSVAPLVNSIAVRFILVPLSYILVAVVAFPDAVAMLETHEPFSIVVLTVGPGVEALAVNFSLGVIPEILVTI